MERETVSENNEQQNISNEEVEENQQENQQENGSESVDEPMVHSVVEDSEDDDEEEYDEQDEGDSDSDIENKVAIDLSDNDYYKGLCTLLEDEQGNNILEYISLLHSELIGVNKNLRLVRKEMNRMANCAEIMVKKST